MIIIFMLEIEIDKEILSVKKRSSERCNYL